MSFSANRHAARQALRRMARHARRFANPQNSFFHICQRKPSKRYRHISFIKFIAEFDNEDKLKKWKNNTYQYNAAGDLTGKTNTVTSKTSTYQYDNQGNLRKVILENGKTIDYAIDPAGRRTGKKVDGALQWQLVWMSGLRPIARLKADNTLEATYYYGEKPNVPEAMDKGGKTYRIVSDQLGSVRLVIDSQSGEVAQQIDYDVWGKVINDTNPGFQPFAFAGGLYDSDTGLTRFGFRDYDAETGRWTAKDPILFNGWDSNLYGFVQQDPVNWIDPWGLVQVKPGSGMSPDDPRIARVTRQLEGLQRMLKKFAGACPTEGNQLLSLFNEWTVIVSGTESKDSVLDGQSAAETNGKTKTTIVYSNATLTPRLWVHEIYHLMPRNVELLERDSTRSIVAAIPWAERSWEKPAIKFEDRIRDLDCTCQDN